VNWKDIGKTLLKSAPLVASLVPGGGPVASMVASALGVEASPDAVHAKLAEDPEAFAKITAMENAHREKLQELALEEERLHQADRVSARQRDIELGKQGRRNIRADMLAVLAIAGLITIMVLLFYQAIPDAAVQPVMYLLGTLNSLTILVYQFEFGSSRGSRNKEAVQLGRTTATVDEETNELKGR
jgi:hypothetical protein